MKLYKSKYITSQHGRSIWRDENHNLYLVVFGIREPTGSYHPDVDIASGKVHEGYDQPEEIDIQWPVPEVTPAESKSMVLVDNEYGFEEVKKVLVFDKMFVVPISDSPAGAAEKKHPYTNIDEIKAEKSQSELDNWERAREYYFALGGMESMIGPREDAEWYWRRAAKLGKDKAESLQFKMDRLEDELDRLNQAYNTTKCCVAAHHGDIDEDGNVWWKLE